MKKHYLFKITFQEPIEKRLQNFINNTFTYYNIKLSNYITNDNYIELQGTGVLSRKFLSKLGKLGTITVHHTQKQNKFFHLILKLHSVDRLNGFFYKLLQNNLNKRNSRNIIYSKVKKNHLEIHSNNTNIEEVLKEKHNSINFYFGTNNYNEKVLMHNNKPIFLKKNPYINHSAFNSIITKMVFLKDHSFLIIDSNIIYNIEFNHRFKNPKPLYLVLKDKNGKEKVISFIDLNNLMNGKVLINKEFKKEDLKKFLYPLCPMKYNIIKEDNHFLYLPYVFFAYLGILGFLIYLIQRRRSKKIVFALLFTSIFWFFVPIKPIDLITFFLGALSVYWKKPHYILIPMAFLNPFSLFFYAQIILGIINYIIYLNKNLTKT